LKTKKAENSKEKFRSDTDGKTMVILISQKEKNGYLTVQNHHFFFPNKSLFFSSAQSSTHPHINTSTHRHINTSTHHSTHRHINTVINTVINTSTHQNSHQHSHRHINTSTHNKHTKLKARYLLCVEVLRALYVTINHQIIGMPCSLPCSLCGRHRPLREERFPCTENCDVRSA